MLLSSPVHLYWRHPDESDVKAELCHATPYWVQDYAIQKAPLQLNTVLMALFQNKHIVFFMQIGLFVHVALEGS